ncbi:MAG: hypothetical protein D6796_00605 [Caldilineae bacterium]|nr:MAG: hypothetical protein D6796_00605 [Caldilineae bacterium]
MRPILFWLGPYPVFSYGVFIVLGTVVLFALALGLGRRAGLAWADIVPVALGAGIGGVVGARLSHVLVEPQKAQQLLDFYRLFQPGTPGNIIGLMIGGYVGGAAMRHSLSLPSSGNFYAPAMAAASVVWRIGCTLGGCCYGTETDLPWGIVLDGVRRHPTMVYEGLFNLLMLWVVWRLRARIRRDNALLFLYFACYALFRFGLEFIRLYPRGLFGLTGIQYLCLGILLSLAIWRWQNRSSPGSIAVAEGSRG